MTTLRRDAIIRSTLWAAYGDALGFITELANSSSAVKSRSGYEKVEKLIPWRRRIGGINGASVKMVSGCYSDDTQLRLATSRAINGNGFFDVEAFSKFELPTWLSYALGGGLGTKAATFSLTQKNKSWFSNFYSQKGSDYIKGGGNGAAMRIQPHVWAATNLDSSSNFLVDVLRNSIVTHGHPRGIAGAIFHALTLSSALLKRNLSFEDLKFAAEYCKDIPTLLSNDDLISSIWIPEWEEKAGLNIREAFNNVSNEIHSLLDSSMSWLRKDDLCYEELVSVLLLDDDSVRGSGTNTTVAAALLCLKLNRLNANTILLHIVNELRTDTDTIATMFGAIAGAIILEYPPEPVQDQEYLIKESTRLYYISQKMRVEGFLYPDLNEWTPQKSAVGYVFTNNDGLFISGFGSLTPLSEVFFEKNDDFLYQWVSTNLGFSLLVKRRRDDLLENSAENISGAVEQNFSISSSRNEVVEPHQLDMLSLEGKGERSNINSNFDIDSLFNEAVANQFNPETIGSHILLLCQKEQYAIESVIAYSSLVAKAKINREKKHK